MLYVFWTKKYKITNILLVFVPLKNKTNLKKMKNLLNIMLAFFLITATGIAQDKKLKKEQEKANQEFIDYSFIDAQEDYLKLANEGFKSEALLKGLGDSFYFTADYVNAVKWYEELYNFEGFEKDNATDYLYRYAQSLKSSELYDKASLIMKEYKVATGEDLNSPENKRDYLKEIQENSGKFELKNVNFNSALSDFAPAFWKNSLVFSSNRTNGKKVENLHSWNDQPFLDLYVMILEGETYGTTPEIISGDINTQYHESTMVYSTKREIVYFTRNNFSKDDYETDKNGVNRLKLYIGKKNKKGNWKIKEVPFNSDQYSVAHPALSVDENILYFASDMPGGFGNSDLYQVEILEDGFGEIKNLGDKINTRGRDTFPFVSIENILYFSSDDRDGLGGLDIYYTGILENDQFSIVNNIAKPLNSSKDDFGLIVKLDNQGMRNGYFSSNREGGKGFDDIYNFYELPVVCKQIVAGVVRDKNTGAIITDATVILLDDDNKQIAEAISDRKGAFNLGELECEKWYTVRASKTNYSIAEERFRSSTELDLELALDLSLTPKVIGPSVSIGEDLSDLLNIKNINFDYDKSFIRSDAAYELEKVIKYMNRYPSVKIDVRSHTDARGSDSYNLELSKRRNASTIDYIINKGGLSRTRVTGRGYGETQLINGCANGVKCEDKEHEKNRRSEFIVVQK